MRHRFSIANFVVGAVLAVLVAGGLVLLLRAWQVSSTAPSTQPRAEPSTPRVAALTPGLTESLRRIGAGRAIVGRHGFDAWTDPAIPVCGDQGGIDAEMLRRVSPTHLYVQWGDKQLPPSIEAIAADKHWIVRNFTLLSIEQIDSAVATMYADLRAACPDQAQRAGLGLDAESFGESEIGKAWSAAVAQRTGQAADARAALGPVLLLYSDRDPVAAAGPGSFHHELLSRLGCLQSLTTGAAYQVLDQETLRRLAPAVIVLLKPRKSGAAPTPSLVPGSAPAAAPALADSVAGRRALGLAESSDTRIILIDDPLAFVPGLNLIDLAAALESQLPSLQPPPPSAR